MKTLHNLVKFASVAFCLLFSISGNNSAASIITLTGADLLVSPNVTFPTTQPVQLGNSIVFGAGGAPFDKLFTLQLGGHSLPSTFSLSLNLTRLPCSGGCSGGADDWDPEIFIGDGSWLVGFSLADNLSGSSAAVTMLDAGNNGTNRSYTDIITLAGFPNIGDSVDVTALFSLGLADTTLDVSFRSSSGSYIFPVVLNASAGLDLTLIRDNDVGEQYQVNSLTIQFEDPAGIPEPSSIYLIMIGLVGLIALWRPTINKTVSCS